MKKHLYFLLVLIAIPAMLWAQGNFSISAYAGSNAPWGRGGFISIDEK